MRCTPVNFLERPLAARLDIIPTVTGSISMDGLNAIAVMALTVNKERDKVTLVYGVQIPQQFDSSLPSLGINTEVSHARRRMLRQLIV